VSNNIKEIVLAATVKDGNRKKLYCKTAFELVEKHGLKLKDIARLCNNEGIKIAKCQLGCFN